MNIGDTIKEKRLQLGLTLEEVGRAVGVGKSTVKKWEDGFIANMRRDKIAKLSFVLELDPYVFIKQDDTNNTVSSCERTTNIGLRIKARRLFLDYTLEQLASKIGTNKQTIHRYENGIISNIPSDKIEALAVALDTTPAYLMAWDEEEKEKENERMPFDLSGSFVDKNTLRMVGRDGSYIERQLTDEQREMFLLLIDQLPDAPEDI